MFVFMLPLWRAPSQCDPLQCLVTAIHTNPHLLPWASRRDSPKCVVKEFTRKLIKVAKVIIEEGSPMELLVKEYRPMVRTVVYHQTPFNSLHFLMATVKLLPLPQPLAYAHIYTYISKYSESHPAQRSAGACVLCLNTEPKRS
jgi:hypothetical protein